jgi:hypothetical protein
MRGIRRTASLLAALLLACGSQDERDVAVVLRPYLSELIAATNEEFDESGVFLGSSPHRERADALFEEILSTPPPAGDHAIAYLLYIYTGEHPGEELVCEAARRGRRMVPIIEAFSRQLPVTGLEPYPKFMQGSGVLPPEAIRLITSGSRCGSQ